MRAIIITGGDVLPFSLLETRLKSDDYIIAVDRGIDYACENSINVDMVLGDFDSVSNYERVIELEKRGAVRLSFPEDKDYTDTELALNWVKESEYDSVLLVGITGSRIDHTLANIFLLLPYALGGIEIEFLTENSIGYVMLPGMSIELEEERGKTFSVLSLTPVVEGLTITGAKYPLKDYRLMQGETLTISNVILGVADIYLKKGVAIVVQVNENLP